ncbi:MAG TPA: tetratricopeptide repeat protein [Hyphomicrobiaceae bacterium]|jgi:tetratricopeptide (TPR) repeat protein|nr:tetratricopeptide repeat protein [Hyphomicrobiaceae bacterium]
MPVWRAIPILILALFAAGCGEDPMVAVQDCQQPKSWRSQVDACTKVIESKPKASQAAKAYDNRCQAYNQLDQPDKAIPDCDMAIKLQPRSASAYNNRGWAREIRKEFDLALVDYGKAIELDPKFALAYANRGDVYAKTGEREKAIAEYRQAIAIEPENEIAQGGLKKLRAR